MKKRHHGFILLIFLIKNAICADSIFFCDTSFYSDRLLFTDSLVNENIFKLRQHDSSIKTVNGYSLINRANLNHLMDNTDVVKIVVGTNRYHGTLQNWELKDSLLRVGDTKIYKLNEIDYLVIQDKVKLSRILYFPFIGAAFCGLMPAMWECIDYLFGGDFNKIEVASFCAFGFTLGLIGSFAKDELTITFIK